MALMKCKPASEWENVAYRDLFQTSIFLDPQTKELYCESLLKTACRISEVWETVCVQSNEGSDASSIREAVEKLMEIVCESLRELKCNPKVESIRRRIDHLVGLEEKETHPKSKSTQGKVDPFISNEVVKQSVKNARELCDLVDEQQRLVEDLTKEEATRREETQKFLTIKTIEFTNELSSKSSQIKTSAEQKIKAHKYR